MSLTILLLPCGVALLYVLRFAYQLLSHGKRIPSAHFTSPFSSIWLKHLRKDGKTGIGTTLLLHTIHGPVVRLSPNEVSVASLEGLRSIYTGGFPKTDFYDQFTNFGGTRNLVSIIGNQEHTARKRILSHVYSKSFIHSSTSIREFSTVLVYDHLRPALHSVLLPGGRDGGWAELDAYALNQALGADFTSAYLMGMESCTGFIENKVAAKEFLRNWKIKSRELPGQKMATEYIEGFLLALMKRGEKTNDEGIVRSQLFAQLESKRGKSDFSIGGNDPNQIEDHHNIIASEVMDNLIAGIETARITLTYLQYELSLPQNASLQNSLREELHTLYTPLVLARKTASAQLPTAREIDTLSLLDAVLKETLRLHPPSPAILPRMVPVGGTKLHGYILPAGTIVGTSSYLLHYNSSIFPNPSEYLPYRWLVKDDEKVKEMNRHFWAFGSGGRMCIGSHYAMYMLKLITAALYTSFETCIIDAEGIEQEDAFLAGPVGEKLLLGIRVLLDE